MFSRSGYQALPLGDFDRFQQSSIGLYGAQKGFFSFGAKQDPLAPSGNGAGELRGEVLPSCILGFFCRVSLWLAALTLLPPLGCGERHGWGVLVGKGVWERVHIPCCPSPESSQGWLAWICHGIITSLVFLLMVVTFPISGWFALKVRSVAGTHPLRGAQLIPGTARGCPFALAHVFPSQIVPAYERMIIFRLGRIRAPQGPGVVLLLPFIDHWQRVDLRTRAFNVPPCKVSCPPDTPEPPGEDGFSRRAALSVRFLHPRGGNRGDPHPGSPCLGLESSP